MIQLFSYLRSLAEREEGQALVEYALILALVSVVAVGLLAVLGTSIGDALTSVTNAL